MKHTFRILVVFDMPYAAQSHSEICDLIDRHRDWRDERDVLRSLKRLGHQVEVCPIFDDPKILIDKIQSFKPDLVFPLCESFANDRKKSAQLLGIVELFDIPMAGSPTATLILCSDKGASKKVLQNQILSIPDFAVVKFGSSLPDFQNFPFPAIVKPLKAESSEGITLSSFVKTPEKCQQQINELQKQMRCDVIVEEFISGREIYISFIRGKDLLIFNPREVVTANGSDFFMTYKAKWDENYRKRNKIRSRNIPFIDCIDEDSIHTMIESLASNLNIKGHARADFRMDEEGRLYFIEANPNPAISREDEFASSARASGYSYDQVIDKIISTALAS